MRASQLRASGQAQHRHQLPALPKQRLPVCGQRRTVVQPVYATAEDTDRTKKTVSALDALLGIEPEEEEKAKDKPSARDAASAASSSSEPELSPSSSTRIGTTSTSGSNKQEQEFEDQFQKIIEKARQLGSAQADKPGNLEGQQQQLRQEFETLLQAMSKDQGVLSKDDIKKLKDACFGPMTFWVTEVSPLAEAERVGVIVRGNLRDDRTKVFDLVCTKVKELFDGKYEVLLVEDADPSDEPLTPQQAARGPKVAFQIVPITQTTPPQAGTFRNVTAAILFSFWVLSSLQLALVANITKLPKETLEFFANPDNFNANPEIVPPGAHTPGCFSFDSHACSLLFSLPIGAL